MSILRSATLFCWVVSSHENWYTNLYFWKKIEMFFSIIRLNLFYIFHNRVLIIIWNIRKILVTSKFSYTRYNQVVRIQSLINETNHLTPILRILDGSQTSEWAKEKCLNDFIKPKKRKYDDSSQTQIHHSLN